LPADRLPKGWNDDVAARHIRSKLKIADFARPVIQFLQNRSRSAPNPAFPVMYIKRPPMGTLL
jgi:hypothetical protein